MKLIHKIVLPLLATLALNSCSRQYTIAGDMTQDVVSGRMLYLSVNQGVEKVHTVDSCLIVHGRFNFMGETDSVVMARLYVDHEMVMPFVIEGGEMNITIDYYKKSVKGGALNEQLNDYFHKMSELQTQWENICDRRLQLYMAGTLRPHILAELDAQETEVLKKIEFTETNFICENYKNPLGAGMFLLLTERLMLPQITPQIDEILRNAPPEFLNSPYVTSFIRLTGYKVKPKK